MNRELAKTIGVNVKRAREALLLTQQEVAERLDASLSHYGNIERGTVLPSVLMFARLSAALGIGADALLGKPVEHVALELRRARARNRDMKKTATELSAEVLRLCEELHRAQSTLDACRDIARAGHAPAVALAKLFVALGLVTADELRGLAAEELQQRRQEVSDTSGKPLSSWLHVADVAADVVLYVMFQGEFVACKVTPANARDLATSLLRAAAHADVAAQRKEPAP